MVFSREERNPAYINRGDKLTTASSKQVWKLARHIGTFQKLTVAWHVERLNS